MLDIHGIAAFDDNYIWCLNERGSPLAAVIDPGDEEPVLEYLDAQGLALAAILVTHKHGDHTGGIESLKAVYPEATVYGPANEPVPLREQALADGDWIRPSGLDTGFVVMDVPGHTEGHVAYLGDGLLFCGDTLFAGGCGRVFSGTHEQLYHSLRRLACLPGDTRVFCAHEYTQANLGFAHWVEPGNAALVQRRREVDELRAAGQPTVPSLLREELATNPFLRTAEKTVVDAASAWAGRALLTGEEVFRAIRTWKDRDYD